MQEDVSVDNLWMLIEPIVSCIPYPRWSSGGCSLSMVTGWSPLMQDEGADVVTR